MKICFLADASSVHTKKWCRYLSQRGCDISVISLNEGEIKGAKVFNLGVNINKVKGSGAANKTSYLFKIKEIRKLIHQINPDILHAHYASSYGLLGSLAGYHPYIISVWGSDVYDFPVKSILHKKILQYNLKKADYLFSTSKVMAKETSKYTNKKLYITPFGVDMNIYKPMHIKNNDSVVIGTVKALETKYGLDYLIKAFAQIVKNNHNVSLKIAGKGSEEQNLKNLCRSLGIEKYVQFLGFLSLEQTVKAYNSFDLAVFPSILDSESFGVSAVEAQACGLPVIVSDVDGLMESTKPDYSSIVVRKKNVEDLVSAMQKLIDDKEIRETMGRNGIEYVKQNYDVNRNFDYIMEIYNNILQSVHSSQFTIHN